MATALTPYQRRLFAFLGVATFFEGYDFIALTQILPNLRADFGLSETAAGVLVGTINAGTVIAYLLVRRADRWGRKRVLSMTIIGYALASFLTGLSPNVYVFGLLQLLARVFLIGEWATSMVIAAEEFPAERRGMVIGVISAFASLGSVVCAGLVPLLLATGPGWRTVYFVGVIPLLVVAYARRNLKETRRFSEHVEQRRAQGQIEEKRRLTHILTTPYRTRVFKLGVVWFVTYLCTQNAVTFWKEFAVAERGMTDAMVGKAITIAALVAMPLVFAAGRLLDWIGRRPGAAVIFASGAFGVFGAFTLQAYWALVVSLIFSIVLASAVLPVLNSYNTELFPTEFRGDAFAWSNNLLGRIGYVLSPFGIGVLAEELGWGFTLRLTAIFPIIALVLIYALLPETKSKELEETALL